MAGSYTVRAKGFREVSRLMAKADKDTRKIFRDRFRKVGVIVQQDARDRFMGTDSKSAGGYRVVVRQNGVNVEQRYRKTTGQHPNFGDLQMRRALLPALEAKHDEVLEEFENALDDIAREFG